MAVCKEDHHPRPQGGDLQDDHNNDREAGDFDGGKDGYREDHGLKDVVGLQHGGTQLRFKIVVVESQRPRVH